MYLDGNPAFKKRITALLLSVQEVGSGNASQKSDEEDFVKVEDLPLQLTVMYEVNGGQERRRDSRKVISDDATVPTHQEELQKRIVEEQQNNNLSVEILSGNAESLTGLVGSAQALKEPGIDRLPGGNPAVAFHTVANACASRFRRGRRPECVKTDPKLVSCGW